MTEIWKDIPGYDGLYAANNRTGEIKSYEKSRVTGGGGIRVYPECILKPVNSNGYLRLNLCKDGKAKAHFVHRLVAETFIPNPDNLPYVCHKDDNPLNNCVDNLFWGTQKDNIDDCQSKGRHAHPKRAVFAHAPDGNMYYFESTHEAARQTGVYHGSIVYCCRGKLKSAGGFIWNYSNN